MLAPQLSSDRRASSTDDRASAVPLSARTLADQVLRLQRSVGNGGVARLLARCPDGSDPTCACHDGGRRPRRPGEFRELEGALASAAAQRRLAREPQPGEDVLPPATGPRGGEPPEMTGCMFGWKDGEWVWSCEGLPGGLSTPDIPFDPRKIPGKLGDLIPKQKGPPAGGWRPFPAPDQAPWLQPPLSLEGICRTNPTFPMCTKPLPTPKKPDSLLRPVGVFYSWDVLFEHDQPAKPQGGMTSAGASTLAWVIEHLEADPTLQVRLVGHASSEGGADANRRLSMRRARAVYAALDAKGLGARVMDFVGGTDPAGCERLEFGMWACGSTQAAADGPRPEDRRVVVTFLRNGPPKPGPLKLGSP